MKNWLITLTVMAMAAGWAAATPMHSDDFSGASIDPQWSKIADNFTWSQSSNALFIDLPTSGNPTYTVIGIKSTTGYVISGDFDMSVKLDWTSYSGYNIRSRVQFYIDANNAITLDHFFTNTSPQSYEATTVRIGGVNSTLNTGELGYTDNEVRITRTDSDVSVYTRALGSDTWVLRNSGTGFSTADGIVNIGVSLPSSATWIDMKVMDFQLVPEPASAGLLIFGGLLAIIRKRRS